MSTISRRMAITKIRMVSPIVMMKMERNQKMMKMKIHHMLDLDV